MVVQNSGERTTFLNKWCWANWMSKQNNLDPLAHNIDKHQLQAHYTCKCERKIITNLVKAKIGNYLHDSKVGKDFLNGTTTKKSTNLFWRKCRTIVQLLDAV